MMKFIKFAGASLISVCVTTALAAQAIAQESVEVPVRFERMDTAFVLRDDGAATTTTHVERRILVARAVEASKRSYISYSTSIEKAEVLEAATKKADGRVIPVPPGNFQIETNSGKDNSSPLFSDRTTMTVVFPDVAVGDLLVLTYRITDTEPMFPGKFSVTQSFSRTYSVGEARVRIDAPLKLEGKYEAHGMEEITNRDEGDRHILEWRFVNPDPVKSKRTDYSVYEFDDEPGVSYSTFRSHKEIADAYGERAIPKAVPSERVKTLAAAIVGNVTDPREQAKLLYEWVSTEIHYAGNCVGLGAVVPHDPELVLDNKLGDCKDHATLLQALLSARNISSTQALINAGSSYQMTKIPVVSMINHVITYIPAWDMYLDSTSDSTPFGMLPQSDQGKPVLLVQGYREGSRTTATSWKSNQISTNNVFRIGSDGKIAGNTTIDMKGWMAIQYRSRFRDVTKQMEDDWAKSVVESGRGGSFQMKHDDAKALTDSFHMEIAMERPDFVNLPGPGAFAIFSPSATGPSIAYIASSEAASDDSVSTTCIGASFVERYQYALPKGVKFASVPKDFKLESGVFSFQASYKRTGDQLLVTRMLVDRSEAPVCNAELNARKKTFYRAVEKHLATQVLFS